MSQDDAKCGAYTRIFSRQHATSVRHLVPPRERGICTYGVHVRGEHYPERNVPVVEGAVNGTGINTGALQVLLGFFSSLVCWLVSHTFCYIFCTGVRRLYTNTSSISCKTERNILFMDN
jgi:hypothetical protein